MKHRKLHSVLQQIDVNDVKSR